MPHPIRSLLNKQISVRVLAAFIAIIFLVICIAPITNLRADPINSEAPGDPAVTAAEVDTALAGVDGLEADSDAVTTAEDTDSAMQSDKEDSSIAVPRDASDGVTIAAANSPAINISLPNAASALDAKPVSNGIVAYASKTDSANSVQVTEDGGVRLLNVIASENAPELYNYELTLPEGYTTELNEDNSVTIYDANGNEASYVDAPWAKDANGQPVQTSYELVGKTLTQTIEHRDSGVAYPLVADPKISLGWGSRCLGSFAGICIGLVKYPNAVVVTFTSDDVKHARASGEWGGAVLAAACTIRGANTCAGLTGFAGFVFSKVPDNRGVAIRFGEGSSALSWWIV